MSGGQNTIMAAFAQPARKDAPANQGDEGFERPAKPALGVPAGGDQDSRPLSSAGAAENPSAGPTPAPAKRLGGGHAAGATPAGATPAVEALPASETPAPTVENGSKKRKSGAVFTEGQRAQLEELFQKNNTIKKAEREKLASEFGCEPKSIANWLQSRRVRAKKHAEKEGAPADPQPAASPEESPEEVVPDTEKDSMSPAGGPEDGAAADGKRKRRKTSKAADAAAAIAEEAAAAAQDPPASTQPPAADGGLFDTEALLQQCVDEEAALRAAILARAPPHALGGDAMPCPVNETGGLVVSAVACAVEGATCSRDDIVQGILAAARAAKRELSVSASEVATTVAAASEERACGPITRLEAVDKTTLPAGLVRARAVAARQLCRAAGRRLDAVVKLRGVLEAGASGRGYEGRVKRAVLARDKLPALAEDEKVEAEKVAAEAAAVAAKEAAAAAKRREAEERKREVEAKRRQREEEKKAKEAEKEAEKKTKQEQREAEKAQREAERKQQMEEKKAQRKADKLGFGSAKTLKKSQAFFSRFTAAPAAASPTAAPATPGAPDAARRASLPSATATAHATPHLTNDPPAPRDDAIDAGLKAEGVDVDAAFRAALAGWRQAAERRRTRARTVGLPPSWQRRPGAPPLAEIHDARFGAASEVALAGVLTWRRKLLWFPADSERPAFFGSVAARPTACAARRPLAKEPELDYDYMSDQDWEPEPEGEALDGDINNDGDDMEEDEADSFVVQDDAMSDGDAAESVGHDGGADVDVACVEEAAAVLAANPETTQARRARLTLLTQLGIALDQAPRTNRALVLTRDAAAPAPTSVLGGRSGNNNSLLLGAIPVGLLMAPGAINLDASKAFLDPSAAKAKDGAGDAASAGAKGAEGSRGAANAPGRKKKPFPDALCAALITTMATNPTLQVNKLTDAFVAAHPDQGLTKAGTKSKIKDVGEHMQGRWFVRREHVEAAGLTEAGLMGLDNAALTVQAAAELDATVELRAKALKDKKTQKAREAAKAMPDAMQHLLGTGAPAAAGAADAGPAQGAGAAAAGAPGEEALEVGKAVEVSSDSGDVEVIERPMNA
ncbi:unnamed protein product [Pedinophyceae sp. YPF-701]|nr:unnamed protein product [Pedinophyceae sp. YPF-701]